MGNRGQFQPGREKSGGRPPGGENKVTGAMREILHEAFEEAGGVAYLVKQAHEQPRAFMALLGKLIPQEIRAEIEGSDLPQVIVRNYTGLSEEELRRIGR